MSDNHDKTVKASGTDTPDGNTLAAQERHVLICLGAALVMQWNTVPAKLRRELFDNAGTMGELLQTSELRGQIARFLHKHEDGGVASSASVAGSDIELAHADDKQRVGGI